MQIKSLRVKSYRSWRIDDNTSAEALGRLKQLEWVERLRGEGCSEATSLAVVGWSRATYYRWLRRYREAGLKGLESGTRAPRGRRVCQWTKQQAQQVLHLRKRYPLWGKRKLWRVLVRERGWTLSESTVGRIVARLVRLSRVEPVSFYYGQVKPKRRRTVYPPCQTLALRDEGEGAGGVDAGGPHERQLHGGGVCEGVQGHLSGQQMERAAGV